MNGSLAHSCFQLCHGDAQFLSGAPTLTATAEIQRLATALERHCAVTNQLEAVNIKGYGFVLQLNHRQVVQEPPVALGGIAMNLNIFLAMMDIGDAPLDMLACQLPLAQVITEPMQQIFNG